LHYKVGQEHWIDGFTGRAGIPWSPRTPKKFPTGSRMPAQPLQRPWESSWQPPWTR